MSLLDKIMLGAGAALIVAIAMIILGLTVGNAHLKTQLAQARSYASVCELANDQFGDLAARQNKLVAALTTAGNARLEQARAARASVGKNAARYRRDAEKLRMQKPQGDDCAAAGALLTQFIAGQK